MRVSYEFVTEVMDGDEIADTFAFDTFAEALAFADPGNVICLRRDRGDDLHGIVDRQYAYAGATEFDAGAAIPRRLLADFARCGIV